MTRVTGKLGKTEYTLEDEPGSCVRVTRKNSDSLAYFYLPKSLVAEFAAVKLGGKIVRDFKHLFEDT